MKKCYILLSALAVAAFAACEKEQPIDVKEAAKGVAFELTASPVDTKTTNDGMVTSWKANDKINLFHAEASTTDYSSNDEFTITSENLAAKKFTGTLASALDPTKSYDWYALYPYDEDITTPANTTESVSFGSNSRTQTGYDNAEHLGGLPLVGLATDVDAADKPTITMNHMAAVLKVVVTNTTSEELTITNVSFTAPVKIIGQFIVDFSDPANPAYSDGTSYCYNYCNLKVNGGTALGNGESATFYIPIKPVTLAKDSEISLKVNTYTKAVTMPSAFTFTPGKMTTINFDYDKTFTSKNFYLASSIAAGDKVMFVNGTYGDVKVMAHYGGANNYPVADGSISAGRLPSTSAMGVYTVAGNSSDGFTFYDPETEQYITATNTTSSNYLKGVSPADAYSSWSVAFASAATITCKGKSSRNVIKYNYNSGSPLYAAYNSDYSPSGIGQVYIFKQDDRTPLTTYEFASTSVTKTPEEATSYTGLTVTSSPVVVSSYSMSGDVIGTINSSTGALSLDGTEGTAIVTASFAGDGTYAPAVAFYTIKVKGNSITLTGNTSGMPSSYEAANTFVEHTFENYKFMTRQITKSGAKIQMRASGNSNGTGTIYNKDTFPGKLKTIIITYDGDANKNCTVFIGSSMNPTGGDEITPSTSGNVYTFDCSTSNVDFFVITNGTGAGYVGSIKIEWK